MNDTNENQWLIQFSVNRGQETCDGCDAEGVLLYEYMGSSLCQACCDEQAEEDGLEELMHGH